MFPSSVCRVHSRYWQSWRFTIFYSFSLLLKFIFSLSFHKSVLDHTLLFFPSLFPSTYPVSDMFSMTHFPYYMSKKFRIFLSNYKFKFPSLFPQASSSEIKLSSIHRQIREPISMSLWLSVLHFTFSIKTRSRHLNIYSYLIWYFQFVVGLPLLLNFAFASVTRQ